MKAIGERKATREGTNEQMVRMRRRGEEGKKGRRERGFRARHGNQGEKKSLYELPIPN